MGIGPVEIYVELVKDSVDGTLSYCRRENIVLRHR